LLNPLDLASAIILPLLAYKEPAFANVSAISCLGLLYGEVVNENDPTSGIGSSSIQTENPVLSGIISIIPGVP
jgi:hypothetical protein